MRYNQFSYIPTSLDDAVKEMKALGFQVSKDFSDKQNLEIFARKTFFQYQNTDYALSQWIADWETDLLSFFQSDRELNDKVFNMVALQLLEFIPNVDFTDLEAFLDKIAFPITGGAFLQKLHQLLATRTVNGASLIDRLVSKGLIPISNDYVFFNGKSLATFDTSDVIREVVYVDSSIDSDGDGLTDLVKVSIIRPNTHYKLATTMTASPYHQGVNGPASDKLTHKMEGDLTVKKAGQINLEAPAIPQTKTYINEAKVVTESEETFSSYSSYTLNDYLLARGLANIYVSGVGTLHSEGFMTSGDYQQVQSYKAVIDWLNGRAIAYTDHSRQRSIEANWASGKVVTTGLSYLGTMSNALATTGVEGLEVIIAEAGISSWYDYYRENGLLVSPGGYPGEDLDSLTEFTYSRALLAGQYLRKQKDYQTYLDSLSAAIDRKTGDYNQFWHDRNYLPQADKVKAEVVFTHGSQDWNVKPIHVFNMFNALPHHVNKHLFFHNGAHVYMNAWQSIDFRESMNALISQKLLGHDSDFQLASVIWQNNRSEQTWQILEHFGNGGASEIFSLESTDSVIQNHYDKEDFERYGKAYQTFKNDLFTKKARSISIDIPITKDLLINGRPRLTLKVKSSENRGLISAQLLEIGQQKYLQAIPAPLGRESLDNGRSFKEEALRELPFGQADYRVISKSHLNLQNRSNLLEIEEVTADDWMTVSFELQPTIYQLQEGNTIRLIFYTTDFEHTIRDNSDYQLTIDWQDSQLELPVD
ncbi:Xaa-Pro dipeptidyl-peptidase [Streptococcus loxodontisalivarius]|uniref:Xaa-Pro dipeptidyl-peptidase n=1 Tax=Streptococcus loxodontisalivarius TaxID=1349415 RepID=A0ABS2PSN1_9STRE|nr:Xaa-Pro dipeptidyl-peptidase [Streptococcus loxodontisalivarius]MBM7642514.1 X-Pro dipeptidyl-peptidase [Streptococcus loxodontisalivarius]